MVATESRRTGISVVGNIPWGTHFCHFYETEEDLLDILIPYISTGLESNEFCMWLVSAPGNVEGARNVLRRAVPEADQHLAARDIEIVPCSQWFGADGTFDLQLVSNDWQENLAQALARGYAGMRVMGNSTWLTEDDWKDFLRFEKELDKLIAGQRITLSCTYPLATSRANQVFDVARTHRFAIAKRNGAWVMVETPELEQAKAEIKQRNEELEQRVVERTRELAIANEELRREFIERIRAEEEQKENQRQYESLVQSIDGIVWEIDDVQSCEFTFVSRQAERLLGYPLDRWLGEPKFWREHLHPDDRKWAFDFCRQATARKKSHQFEYRMIAADGRVVWLRDIVAVNVRDDNSVRLSGVMVDITESKHVEAQLKNSNEKLRALSASLQSAREAEGTRIAREIHDELGSTLTSLRWELESFDKLISAPGKESQLGGLREKVAGVLGLTDTMISSVRRIASELRPSVLDDLGLMEAIEWETQHFQTRTGIICHCVYPQEEIDLGQEQSTAVFRILQESLTNILRHAQATKIEISTSAGETGAFVLTISDNGRGITEDEKSGSQSLGLLGMRERAHLVGGSIDITGVAGKGTTVTVRVPTPGAASN